MDIARREILKVAGVSTAAAMLGSPLGAAATGVVTAPADHTSPEARLRCFRLMRAALDDRLNFSWMKARYFGVVDDEMRPMFGVVAGVFTRMRPLPDNEFEMISREIAYFTDHDGNEVIHTYDNPYTGETVSIPEGGYPPSPVIIGSDLSHRFAQERPGMQLDHRVAPLYMNGDQVWMTETVNSAVSFPGASRPFRYSDLSTYHASRSAIENPDAVQVPTLVGYSSVVSWRPWLAMPTGHPGHLSAFGSGRTGSNFGEVPAAWLAEAERRIPEFLADPESALNPVAVA